MSAMAERPFAASCELPEMASSTSPSPLSFMRLISVGLDRRKQPCSRKVSNDFNG